MAMKHIAQHSGRATMHIAVLRALQRTTKNFKEQSVGAESDQKPRRTLLDADLWAGCLCNKLYLTTHDDSDEHGVLCTDDGGVQGGGASNKSSNDQQHSE